MVNIPPSTGNAQLDGFLRSVADDLRTLSKPREGWRLSDFAADVSEAISDRRDLIDIVGNWSDINQIKATFEAEIARYEKLYADSKILGDKYQDHAEIFAQVMEWWAQNYKLIEDYKGGSGGGGLALVSPQDFGAVASGTADDTKAIQAAIDSLPPSGGIVYFPAGTYLVNGAKLRPGSDTTKGAIFLRGGVALLGEGTRSKILLADGTGNVDMLYAKDSADISLQNLVIDAGPRMAYGPGGESDPLHWTTCIQFTGCNNLVMNNVTVTRGNIEGIYLHNCTQFRLDNIRAYDNGLWREDASGLHLDACFNGVASNLVLHNNGFHGLIMSACWECTINNVQCYENGWQGIHMQHGSNKNVINGATLTRNARGLYIRDWGTDNNLFSDLVVSDNAFNGVMTWVTYGNVINGLQAISNGEYGVQTAVNEDELFVWAGHFKDNGGGDYDSVDDSKLYINGTLV